MARESEILKDIVGNYDNDVNEWADIHREGQLDARVVSGDVWDALDPMGARQRRAAKRPMCAPDEIGQYENQVVNDFRANPRGIKFSPTGGGATRKSADLYQNKTREIEYRSHATQAYSRAAQNMVERGYGYIRINKRYVHEALYAGSTSDRPADASLFNQELWIDGVNDPDMIVPDPYAQKTSLSDMRRCFALEWYPVNDFKQNFPDAKIQNFSPSNTSTARSFFTSDRKQVLVAEAWTKEEKTRRTLLLLKSAPSPMNPTGEPIPVWKDQLQTQPSSDLIVRSRIVPILEVKQRLTNGLEILREELWQGQFIPITGCFGKIIYVDTGSGSKRQILSMTRLARQPFMLYCYIRTCQQEIVGLTPKFPYFFPDGQLDPKNLQLLAESLHVPVAAIAYKPTLPSLPPGTILPPPSRNPFEGSALAYLDGLAEAMRRAIQSAMAVTPLPTAAQRNNDKSGVALKQIESSGQRGAFHFVDSFDDMVQQAGEIIQDVFGTTYDTMRETGVMDPKGQASVITINNPADPDSPSSSGDHQVTVSAGPSTESQQQAADYLVDVLVAEIAMVAQVSGVDAAREVLAESIRNKVQGPAGDELAKIINPPREEMGPQQAQQAMAENQQLKGVLQQMKAALDGKVAEKQIEQQGKERITFLQESAENQRNREDNETKLAVAALTSKMDHLSEQMALFFEERHRLGTQQHEREQARATRGHELGMRATDHHLALDEAERAAPVTPEPPTV